MIRPIRALAVRELVRFFRQPHRVVGSLAQPLLFWLFLGSGFSASFRPPGLSGMSYLEYFYPGILLMLLLFSGIFSTITIIEDRSQGLLQAVLVAPLPRIAIVLGKVMGSMSVALIQVALLLLAIPWLGLHLGVGEALLLLFGLLLATLGFTTLGFLIAWNLESTAGFHAIMSVFLMPLWLLSGALFPMDHTPAWLQAVMQINPVTHALHLIRLPFYQTSSDLLQSPDYQLSMAITLLWAVFCLSAALWQVRRIEQGAKMA
ncbi:ABC transporter permease [Candidatus Magnetaquicoccus inordinatus]|uniref:ABC transporter permease n=1 Tax=Candidatus Magnetaquicoccus inordinatus TaxID=2496818 RepID=UPI00102B740F|nr:ABC transporter permease [Candidatus Magnetaquicoccus inordinatus]